MAAFSVLCFCLLVCLTGQIVSAQEKEQQPNELAQISKLVALLSSDLYRERQRAVRELSELGEPVLKPLTEAVENGDPETRLRAVSVIGRLAVTGSPAAQAGARKLLSQWLKHSDRTTRALARKTVDGLGPAMHQHAITALREMGATIDVQQALITITIDESFKGGIDDYGLLRWLRLPCHLTVLGPQMDNSAMRQLSGMLSLESLIIKRGTLDNHGLALLKEMPELRTLHLYYVAIDDSSIDALSVCKNLIQLRLFGTRVTQDGSKKLAERLTATEVDRRNGAFLGIYFTNTTGPCVVDNVVRGSAADRSGLKAGDRVIRFVDLEIETGDQFLAKVADYFPGDKVKILVERDMQQIDLELELGRFPDREVFK